MIEECFEGPEKKLELVVDESHGSLRKKGDGYWSAVVKAANAEILSTLRSDSCDAYLLSESSLFVFDDHLTMITCGRTTLVDAAAMLLSEISRDQVRLLVYERKNELFPRSQPSSFYDDARRLNDLLPGRALRFGEQDDHHIHLFHSSATYQAQSGDTTLEILMHGIPEEVASIFVGRSGSRDSIAEECGLTDLLPGFALDEFAFSPEGYSMNALRGGTYYTVHVTPEQVGSYVSFETNLDAGPRLSEFVAGVAQVFRPRALDVLSFSPTAQENAPVSVPGYMDRADVQTDFLGYDVRFSSFSRPPTGKTGPVELSLSGVVDTKA